MGEAARRRNAPPPAEGEAVMRIMHVRVVTVTDVLTTLADRIEGDDADKAVIDARRLVIAATRVMQTIRAPYADPVTCGCCRAPTPKKPLPPALIIGFEVHGPGFHWEPVCAKCAALDKETILARFKQNFESEHTGVREVAPPDDHGA
jgi:hypothetical protein